jgi:lipopolysaccharide export system protein LptA
MDARAAATRVLVAIVAAGMCAAGPADAPQRECDLIDRGLNARTEQVELGGMTVINFLDPFLFRCTDGTELRANRGSLNQTTRVLELWGDVFFEDPVRMLTADEATYNSAIGRLHARGNVFFRNLEEGSTIRGPELEYFSATEMRPQPQVHARQRPHLTLQPREAAEDAEPLEIDADDVTMFGQDQLNATGSVVITRTDMRATSGEAQYNGETGGLELRGGAAIRSREYDLGGEVIQAQTADGVLEHVHARTAASLSGDDLDVTAPDLQLFFADELLQRAVARGDRARPDDEEAGAGPPRERAVATSRTFRLEADSIDALVPGQRVEQVVAIGSARGESIDTLATQESPVSPDDDETLDVRAPEQRADTAVARLAAGDRLTERDWIRGDTIIGYFSAPETIATAGDTATAPGDTAVVLDRIIARGSALSLYRLAKEDGQPGDRRGINFLVGDVIALQFAAGELELAEVDGLRKGIFLDPAVPSPPPGGTAAPPEDR